MHIFMQRCRSYAVLMIIGCAFSCTLLTSIAHADVDPRTIAYACSSCHGTDGALSKPGFALLKGQDADGLAKVLLDFKYDRLKKVTIMDRISKGYTDAELIAVANYFASLGNPNK